MVFSVLPAEGVYEPLYETVGQERRQYREALIEGSEYSFAFDITEA